MSVSRKEFLARGLVSFGRDLLEVVRGESAAARPGPEGEVFGPLLVDNGRCLAQRGGCFACIDHCPRQAVSIRLGVGIAIDRNACDGCGLCIPCCPIEPAVISLRQVESASPAPA